MMDREEQRTAKAQGLNQVKRRQNLDVSLNAMYPQDLF